MSGARRWLPWVLLAAVVVVVFAVAVRSPGPASPAARAAGIEAEVKCPQCSGQSALESNAPAARAVRAFVTAQVQAGRTNADIEAALRDRYGADLLLRPPSTGIGGLVWVIPVVVFAAAVAGLAVAFRRWRSIAAASRPVSAEDRARVERALKEQRLWPGHE